MKICQYNPSLDDSSNRGMLSHDLLENFLELIHKVLKQSGSRLCQASKLVCLSLSQIHTHAHTGRIIRLVDQSRAYILTGMQIF